MWNDVYLGVFFTEVFGTVVPVSKWKDLSYIADDFGYEFDADAYISTNENVVKEGLLSRSSGSFHIRYTADIISHAIREASETIDLNAAYISSCINF